ncbi:hypothetical protein Tco_0724767 [Tanacetum coccineum]|uniref:Uncharacterized protein n=1 Tax=Tanacetum coccineum TaxID=301880 RepID=A0ABQ4YC18_9ASTR
MSQEKVMAQLKEMKRLANLKAEKEKSKKFLKKILNPATIRAQTQKMAEHEAKRQNMLDEYNHQISLRADKLPITKISYVVNPNMEAIMKITRGDNPLNLIVHPNIKLKTLESKSKIPVGHKPGKKLGLPPPLALATFGMTTEDKKRKRAQILKEDFVTKNISVDGMHKNLVPPLGIEGRQGLVIKEPKSGIFFYNGNWDLVFQREDEFHLATTAQLIRLQRSIQRDTPEAEEMFRKLELTIEARDNAAQARDIVKDNLDGLGQHIEQHQTYSSQRHHQGSQRLVEDIHISWDGYQLAGNSISPKGVTKVRQGMKTTLQAMKVADMGMNAIGQGINAMEPAIIGMIRILDPLVTQSQWPRKSKLERYKTSHTNHKEKEEAELKCKKALGLLADN